MAKHTPEQAAKSLRAFWRTGATSWSRVAPVYRHGRKADLLAAEAARLGVSGDTVRKAWVAADAFTREQVDELAALVVARRATFGPTHLVRLLALRDARRRWPLARSAIAGRWGLATLGRKVQAANGGRRPGVGRRPAVPAAGAEFLCALDALCDKWERWCQTAVAGNAIPAELDDVIRRATAAVGRVRDRVQRGMSQ